MSKAIAQELRKHALYHETARYGALSVPALELVDECDWFYFHPLSTDIPEAERRMYLLFLAEYIESETP